MKIASIDVDAQCGFSPLCPLELPVPDAEQIVHALNRNAKKANFRIGSKDAHPINSMWLAPDNSLIGKEISCLEGYNNYDVYWPLHCVPGTKGFDLLPGLPKPEEYDFFIWKGIERHLHPYGIFYHDLHSTISTGLHEWLQQHRVTKLIFGGLALEYCVFTSILEAIKLDYITVLNTNATKALNQENIVGILSKLENLGCFIESF